MAPPDLTKLQMAWLRLVKQLVLFRTTFHFSKSVQRWIQACHLQYKVPISMIRNVGPVDQSIREFARETTFEDEKSFLVPPYRIGVIKDEHGIWFHALIIHHALYDGESIRMLFGAVERLYNEDVLLNGCQFVDVLPELIPLETSGTDFWSLHLQNFTPHCFWERCSSNSKSISKELHISRREIEGVCRALSVTMQSLAQSALWKVLSRLFSSTDIVFGRVVVGRDIQATESIIGPLLVILV